jgi:transcriptional antiterminator RfaH
MTHYLIHTKPGQEERACLQLRNQGYDVFLPRHAREKMRGGKRILATTPLFPRYLFIRLNQLTDNWSPIRSTLGVSNMVRFGNRYATVDDDFITALRERIAQQEQTPEPLYQRGQPVRIVRGPFAGIEAVFAENDGDSRVVVLLNFLQQEKQVSMPIGAVRLAA